MKEKKDLLLLMASGAISDVKGGQDLAETNVC